LDLPGVGWAKDRARGLINLAEARLATQLEDKHQLVGLLSQAESIATKSHSIERPMKVEILAEAWALRRSCTLGDDGITLQNAFRLARDGSPKEKVEGLGEIARRQARLGLSDDADETLREAREASASPGSPEHSRVLLDLAICGLHNGLAEEIADWRRSPRSRALFARAEVERRLSLGDFDGAVAGLAEIPDLKVRSHAARSVGVKYASLGQYDRAIAIGDHIDSRRGELIADLARAIANHASFNPDFQLQAQNALVRLLLQCADHLDGTYRVIAYTLRSRSFTFDRSTLEDLIQTMELQKPFQIPERPSQTPR
jgi:hypothetical protein